MLQGGNHLSHEQLRPWIEFIKRVAISHKRNFATVGYIPDERKIMKEIKNQRYYCLKRNTDAIETFRLLRML
jgi:hypothetical protein